MEPQKKRGRPARQVLNNTLQPYQPPTDDAPVIDEPAETTQGQQRVFSSQQQHTHDLYKLEVSPLMKNIALDGAQPEYEKVEHVHFFHTITSDGKPQNKSTAIGGHFHKMELIPQGKDLPPIVKCVSGPMREVIKVQYGKRVRTEVPVNDVDFHTHEVSYKKSNIIVERTKNVEAAKAEAEMQRRYQSAQVAGVTANED